MAARIMATPLRPMPTSTLWRAMCTERRPISIASATRSNAVDRDHDVGGLRRRRRGRGAHRDAHVGHGQRRRVVDRRRPPSRRRRRERSAHLAHERQLVLGREVGEWTSSSPTRRATSAATAASSPVTSAISVTPARRSRATSAGGVVAQAVAPSRATPAARPSTPTRMRGAAVRRGERRRARRGGGSQPCSRSHAAMPADHPPALHAALDRPRRAARHVVEPREAQVAGLAPCLPHERLAPARARRAGRARRPGAGSPSPAGPFRRHDPLDVRASEGQRAGLVEEDGARAAERLDRAGALDDHAAPGGARDARRRARSARPGSAGTASPPPAPPAPARDRRSPPTRPPRSRRVTGRNSAA